MCIQLRPVLTCLSCAYFSFLLLANTESSNVVAFGTEFVDTIFPMFPLLVSLYLLDHVLGEICSVGLLHGLV